MSRLLPGGVFRDRWHVVRKLPRRGGQGETWVVREGTGTREYVLKLLRGRKASDPKARLRMHLDVYAVRQISHDHVVRIVDHNTDMYANVKEQFYYVTQYEPYGDLQDNVSRFTGDLEAALPCFLRLCDGVRAAHEVNVVHRDIKPQNVVFRDPELTHPVLIDFGVCRLRGSEQHPTSTQEAVGPWRIRPPELASGGITKDDPRSDIYLLGHVLYFMLSGGRWYEREVTELGVPVHRTEGWDLSRRSDDPRFGLLNSVLDRTVALRMADRYPAVATLMRAVTEVLEYDAQRAYPSRDIAAAIAEASSEFAERSELVRELTARERDETIAAFFDSVMGRALTALDEKLTRLPPLRYCQPIGMGIDGLHGVERAEDLSGAFPWMEWKSGFGWRLTPELPGLVGVRVAYFLHCDAADVVTCVRFIHQYENAPAQSVYWPTVISLKGTLGSEAFIATVAADLEQSAIIVIDLFRDINRAQ
jgi:hypothetical protein